jgi:hypothetical protein
LQYPCGFFSHCYLFFGGSKSVIVPSAISTAKAVVSDSVGWATQKSLGLAKLKKNSKPKV